MQQIYNMLTVEKANYSLLTLSKAPTQIKITFWGISTGNEQSFDIDTMFHDLDTR